MNFAELFTKTRTEKNMTQDNMAYRLNVSAKTISAWENGRSIPSNDLWYDIADFLDISIVHLYALFTESDVQSIVVHIPLTKSKEKYIKEQMDEIEKKDKAGAYPSSEIKNFEKDIVLKSADRLALPHDKNLICECILELSREEYEICKSIAMPFHMGKYQFYDFCWKMYENIFWKRNLMVFHNNLLNKTEK